MANFTPQEIEEILQEFFDVTGKRQYIGARYVPIFGRKDEDTIEWDNTKPYEPLTIVLYEGNSYTSRTYVPADVPITDTHYWALTGNYNAQVELYRQEVARFVDSIQEKAFAFDTVADMQACDNLYIDAICHTNGFYSRNDGGDAWYVVTNNEIDSILNLQLQDELTATYIGSEYNVRQFGCKCDGTDETILLNNIISVLPDNVYISLSYGDAITLYDNVVFDKAINIDFKGTVILKANGRLTFGSIGHNYEYHNVTLDNVKGDAHNGNCVALSLVNARFNTFNINTIDSCKYGIAFNIDIHDNTQVSLGQNIFRYVLIRNCDDGVVFFGGSQAVWDDNTVVWAEGNQFMGGFINRCYHSGIWFQPNIKCGDSILTGPIDNVERSGAYDVLDETTHKINGVTKYSQGNLIISNFLRNNACVFPITTYVLCSQIGLFANGLIRSNFALAAGNAEISDNMVEITNSSIEMSGDSPFIDLKDSPDIDRQARIILTTDKTLRLQTQDGDIQLNSSDDIQLNSNKSIELKPGADSFVNTYLTVRGYGVQAGTSQLNYQFPTPKEDSNYSVFVTPNWSTTVAVTGRTTQGFIVTFGTPAPGSSEVEFLITGQMV